MADHLGLFSIRVPGFGRRSLDLDDFNLLAVSCGYHVEEIEYEEIYGMMVRQRKRTYIFLNSRSDTAEKTISAFHEGFHALCSNVSSAMRGPVHNEEEWAAEAFGLACYIPRADAERMSSREIAAAYRVRLKLARLRKLAIKHFDI